MKRFLTLGLVLGVCLAPGSEVGAFIEDAASPVLTNSRFENVTRDAEQMCFTWVFEKHRAPPQQFFLFYATGSEDKDRSMLAARVVSDGAERPLRSSKAAAVHKSGSPRLCFTLPYYLNDDREVTIEGFAVYQGLLWRLPYRIGPVTAAGSSP